MSPDDKRAFADARAACPDDEDEIDGQEAPEVEESEAVERQGEAEGRKDQDPGAEQRQAELDDRAPVETAPGPPADGAPGQQDEATTPPVEVPTPDPPADEAG